MKKSLALVSIHNPERIGTTLLNPPWFSAHHEISPSQCVLRLGMEEIEALFVAAEGFPYSEILSLVDTVRMKMPQICVFIYAHEISSAQQDELFAKGVHQICCVSDLPSAVAQFKEGSSDAGGLLPAHILRAGPLELNLLQRTALRSGKQISLRPKEFLIIEFMIRNANRWLTPAMFSQEVWGSSYKGLEHAVEIYIKSLKRKVDGGFALKLLHVRDSQGYMFSYARASGPSRKVTPMIHRSK